MPKTLITGANGFVGKHLVRELLANGHEVVQIGGRTPANDDPTIICLDLSNRQEAAQLDFTDVTGVIHLAGLAAVGPSFDDPMRYITTNSAIESNLFEAALAQGVTPRFVIISTGALYDARAELPLTETSSVIASSPYAVSKLTQEQLAGYYSRRGFETIIARPFNHIGPGQEPGFIVPDIAEQIVAVEKGAPATVRVGNLDAKRDYTDVRDIARAYRLLLEKGTSGETYNVCSGKSLSGHNILSGLLNAADSPATPESDPAKMRPADNPDIYGSHDKLTAATGWQPTISIEKTLADVIADWRSRD